MDVQLPVYLYDVVTTGDAPRVVVTSRTESAARDLATRLNDAPLDGAESFTVAAPRVASVSMAVEPGSSVTVRGYEVASEVLAAALQPPAPAPAPEPPPEVIAP